ncbi:MAG: S41 family peptidase [Myxococcales bacterium]|nr:MAG: S41 family peptidase [Myxococcales bacterium]
MILQKMNKIPIKKRVSAALALVLAFACGAAFASTIAAALPTSASPYRNLGVFAQALAYVERSYVDEPDQDKLIQGAVRGMVLELDPHSAYMDPQAYRVLNADTEGRFGGIGVEIDASDGWLTVVGVFDGGPAERARIEPGDRFVFIERQEARDMPISEAIRLMRGEPGTPVHFRLRRQKSQQVVDMTLRREIIRVHAVEARLLADQVVYLQLKAFQKTTTTELRRALDEAASRAAKNGGIQGLILDLRNNPGGLLDEAIGVSDEFLSRGTIVTTRGRGGVLIHEATANAAGTRPEWPMVVLINQYSASAAEIVSGALQDNKRATIVGLRSFGKGSVQTINEFPDGSALKLTIARYYTPSGRSIQAEGIEPDVIVEQIDPDKAKGAQSSISEAALEGHLPNPLQDESKVIPEPKRDEARTLPQLSGTDAVAFDDDYQARIAHQVLRAFIAAK